MLCSYIANNLEHAEDLLHVESLVGAGAVLDDVELNSLGQRTALSDGDGITLTNVLETRRAVYGHVLMSLLVTSILAHILKVISTDNYGALHLVGDDHALKDSTTDGNISSKRALLVDVVPLDSSLRRLEPQPDALVVSHALLALLPEDALAAHEDSILLLVGLFGLLSFSVLRHNG